jgi:phage gp29-like protein
VELAAPIKGGREGQRFSADQELVERLVETTTDTTPSPIPAAAIRLAIAGASTPEDLHERLAALYRGQDAGEFRGLLERALFTADCIGYTTAEKRIGVTE